MSKLSVDAPSLRMVAAFVATLALGACSMFGSKPAAPESSDVSTQTAAASPNAKPAAPIPDAVRQAIAAAQTSMQAGDWESAARALQAIVDQNPDLPGPAVNLGIAYAHLKRNDDARKIIDSTVQRWPTFAPAQHQLGRLLSATGKFEGADAAYAKAVAADPNYALAWYDRGVLNELYLQRLPEALQDYETYQRLQSPPDEQVNRWIVDLRRRTQAPAAAKAPAPPAPTTAPATKPAPGGSAS
jgi:tetratricopeptide (TPR) repeat protein